MGLVSWNLIGLKVGGARHALAFRRFVGLDEITMYCVDTVFDDHGSVPISWARFCVRSRVLASCAVCHDGHSSRNFQSRCPLLVVYNRYIFIFKLIT